MADVHDVWFQEALVREYDRGDDFEGVTGAARAAAWFNPRWRTVLVKWYKEIARVYTMCPTTVENAVFYMDSFFAITLQRGHELVVRDFQLVGMVALLVSSKMFSAGSQIKVADLIQLAPQLNLTPRDLCNMELTLIQTLKFNLLVPSSVEFVQVLLLRLADACESSASGDLELLLDPLHAWAAKYLGYLEKEFSNVEFNQSEKALASAFCALAKWSIAPLALASAEHEAEAIKAALAAILSKAAPAGDLAEPSVARAHCAWRAVAAHNDLASICTVRTRFIERRIVSAISHDKDAVYPASDARSLGGAASVPGPEDVHPAAATPAHVKVPIAVRPSALPVATSSAAGLAPAGAEAVPTEVAATDAGAATAFTAVSKREADVVLQGQSAGPQPVASSGVEVQPTPCKDASKRGSFKAVADDEAVEGSVSPDDVAKFESCGTAPPALAKGNKATDFDGVASPAGANKRRASSRLAHPDSAHGKRQK